MATRDEWQIESNSGHGWEVVAAADTWKEASELADVYRAVMLCPCRAILRRKDTKHDGE